MESSEKYSFSNSFFTALHTIINLSKIPSRRSVENSKSQQEARKFGHVTNKIMLVRETYVPVKARFSRNPCSLLAPRLARDHSYLTSRFNGEQKTWNVRKRERNETKEHAKKYAKIKRNSRCPPSRRCRVSSCPPPTQICVLRLKTNVRKRK